MEDVSKLAVMFRVGERVTLSVIILTVSIIVMIAFWRSVQKVDFQISGEKIGTGGSVLLGTPVFVLLALVGYAYVSLSNPITVETPESKITGITSTEIFSHCFLSTEGSADNSLVLVNSECLRSSARTFLDEDSLLLCKDGGTMSSNP